MATFDMPMLNSHTKPDNSGNVYWEPLSAVFSTVVGAYDPDILAFAGQSSREGVITKINIPQNYSSGAGNPTIVVDWSATVTANSVVWYWDYLVVRGNDTASYASTTPTSSGTVSDVAPGTARSRLNVVSTNGMGATRFSPGDEVMFRFSRDGGDASDSIAATVWLFNLMFRYNDT